MQNVSTLIVRLECLLNYRRFSTTMHCQKSGLDIETCTSATWQLWFGAGLFLL